MIKLQDLSELGYGGLVTGMAALDAKRLEEAKYDPKDVYKSAKFWGYLGPGVAATVMNVIGKPRGMGDITERLMHGFIYGFPAFIKETVEAVRPPEAGGKRSSAVKEAQRLLASRQAAAKRVAAENAGLLGAGRGTTVGATGVFVEEQEILA